MSAAENHEPKWPDNAGLKAAMLAFSERPDGDNRRILGTALMSRIYSLAVPLVNDENHPDEKCYATLFKDQDEYTHYVFSEASQMYEWTEVHSYFLMPCADLMMACVDDKTDFVIIDPGADHCVAIHILEGAPFLFCPKHNNASTDPLSSLRMS